jgi:excisionase family DNA binding protein
MPETNIFTVQELADYLRMQPVTIYKHAKAGKLPGFKVGANWRFKKATIDGWIAEQEDQERSGPQR